MDPESSRLDISPTVEVQELDSDDPEPATRHQTTNYADNPEEIEDEQFWSTWLLECQSLERDDVESEEPDFQLVAACSTVPPDPEFYLDPVVPGYEAWEATQAWAYTVSKVTREDYDAKVAYLAEVIANEPFEFEMSWWIARLYDFEGYEVLWFDEGHQVGDGNAPNIRKRLQPSDILVFKVSPAIKDQAKRIIVQSNKVQNNLNCTIEDLTKNPTLVKAAVLAELKRWASNGAFRRISRAKAFNMLTSRYVFTWKRMADGSRYMKCRLCVHGFEDIDKSTVDTYSGTSSRWGQRGVVSVAVQQQWPMASLDVGEAFLKGLSFDEVHKLKAVSYTHLTLPTNREV